MRLKYILITLFMVIIGSGFWVVQFGPGSFIKGYFLAKPNEPAGTITLFEPHGELSYFVYLPEGYDQNSEKTYDVIYHLHGAMPMPRGIALGMVEAETRVLANEMEHLVKAGAAKAAIIVSPYDGFGMSMWSDSSSNHVRVESQIINELMPKIAAQYALDGTRETTYIQGFSMGGFGALKIGLKYPNLFSKITSWDGAVHSWETLTENRASIAENMFSSSAYFDKQSPWVAANNFHSNSTSPKVSISLFSGKMASPSEYTEKFVAHLDKLDIKNSLKVTNCWHDPFCLMSEDRVKSVYGMSR